MEYKTILEHSPTKKRTSEDRFSSPIKSRHRSSLTPNINQNRHLSRIRDISIPLPKDTISNSPRLSINDSHQAQSQCLIRTSRHSSISSTRSDSFGTSGSSSPLSAQKKRNIPMKPSRIAYIDDIPDDYYLSPFDWSLKGSLGFALNFQFILINPKTMDFTVPNYTPDNIDSIKFSPKGDLIFFGCESGDAEIFDLTHESTLSAYNLFESTILVADWKENMIVAGGRQGRMAIIDNRQDPSKSNIIHAQEEEMLSAKIHYSRPIVISTGNESVAKIWDLRNFEKPLITYEEHAAPIKGISWCPYNPDIIATGGGMADRCIKTWNVTTGETLKSIDTGSQVCNLFWNKEYNEIFSTHGFSQNHLALWKGSDLAPIASFHTHKQRVLFMCPSPDGTTVATAAPEDTLQIWRLFPEQKLTMSQSLLLIR